MDIFGIIVLLGMAYLVSYLTQNQYNRILFGSMIGIGVFVVWPHVVFLAELNDYPDSMALVLSFSSLALLLLIACIFAKRGSTIFSAAVAFILFATTSAASLIWIHPIRDYLASLSGFYQASSTIILGKAGTADILEKAETAKWKKAELIDGGIEFKYPSHWETRTLETTGQVYFAGGGFELRPGCVNDVKESLPEIVQQIRSNHSSEVQYRCVNNVDLKQCIVKTKKGEKAFRYQWYGKRSAISQLVFLDMLVGENLPVNEKTFNAIVASVEFFSLPENPLCPNPIEWF